MYGFVIPIPGWNLLAKMVAGETLVISRIMVGQGKLTDDINPAALTDLIQPVAAATSTIPVTQNNIASFIVEYRSDLNGGLDTGFWLNEYGVFAIDPDEGEILLYYGTLGDFPQFVSPYAGGSLDILRYPVSIILTDDINVQINYPAIAFMTAEEIDLYFRTVLMPVAMAGAQDLIDQHNVDPHAHPDIRVMLNELLGRIGRLEDMLIHNITGNPFMVTFGTLDEVVVSGVWNQAAQRIEF